MAPPLGTSLSCAGEGRNVNGGDIRIRVLIDNAEGATGLHSQWGLSFWIETPDTRVLLDCGGSGAFLQNARQLREPVDTADAFVLSHGHFDHGGGIHTLVDAAPSACLVLHPGALAPRWSLLRSGKPKRIGLPDRSLAVLRAVPERSIWAVAPLEVAPGVWASGPVPRRHLLEEAERTFFLDTACTIRDQVVDDQAMWIETPAGLVVLCGCAHSGVMNTVRYVRETVAGRGATGAEGLVVPVAADGLPAVRALLGGMHLLHARKERLQATADYLEALDLELCAPCHCTGKRATTLLGERLPDAFAEIVTGCELKLAYATRRPRGSLSLEPREARDAETIIAAENEK
jgi:7,8-dihydropterin-6-yl-methyl-4-(beta-D-ribofuranosyl)aminobenzene 5'-phosphate synthase